MNKRRRRILRALGAASLGAFAGCGGTEDGTNQSPASEETTTTTQPETQTRTPAETLTPTDPTSEASTGPPTEEANKLVASDGDGQDFFGWAVAVSGDGSTAIIGAREDEDPNGSVAGSAYVFRRVNGEWTQQAKLAASDGDIYDNFGGSVAVTDDGSTAIVGAYGDDNANGESAGAAYVFSQADGSWAQQTKLTANDGGTQEKLGSAVALPSDGTTALVGAPMNANENGDNAGSVYVFTNAGSEWTQQAKFVPNDGDASDYFGNALSVSADGSTAIIGARRDADPNGDTAGSAYVFTETSGTWIQDAKLAADDGNTSDFFGQSVGVSGDGTMAVVGANQEEEPNGEMAGAAYVFTTAGGTWTQQTKLAADDGDANDFFGGAVALADDGSTVIIGASNDEDPNGTETKLGGAGAAYVFSQSNESWTQQAKLAADDGEPFDSFGGSVTVTDDGSTALVGSRGDTNSSGDFAGAAYVFE